MKTPSSNTNSNPMKTTKTSRFSKPSRILVASIAACAVLGLASSASAQSHNWSATAPGLSWSDANNWSPATVPGAGNSVRFELPSGAGGTTPGSPIVMDKDYSAGALLFVRFTGHEDVSIQNYLKVTDYVGIEPGDNGGWNAYVTVTSSGTIDGAVQFGTENDRVRPILDFAGGNWAGGNVRTGGQDNRQGGIIKVSSILGTLTPGAATISRAPDPQPNRKPEFSFVLTGNGATAVAPITFTAADPLQFTGPAAGTNPFKLTVDASAYSGTTVDVPLIVLNNADTDRMFGAGNISITAAPAGKGAFVTQTDTGSTLTLVDAGDWSGGASPDTQWATAGNWTGGNVPGSTLARAIANFPTGVLPATVTLDGTSPTLAVLNINSGAAAALAYSIGQGSGGTINLGATPTGSANAAAQINVLKGTSNTISAPVALSMNGQINTAASTSLTMSGAISGSGFSLTKVGAGTLVLSGGVNNSYTGATIIEEGILSVSTLANAGVNSDLGAYATPGAAGIVIKGGTLKYTGSTMGTAIDRGITITANSTVDLPIAGNMRLGSFTYAAAAAYDLNVTGTSATTSRLYIDSVTVPTSTVSRQGPVFKPAATASLTIGTITGNGNFQMVGAAGSSDNIITGAINLGRGHFNQSDNNDRNQVFGPIAANTWTIMGENTFDGSWYAAAGIVKIMSPGSLVGPQNVSYAFGRADTVSWPGGTDKLNKFYNGNTQVQLLNDLSTSYEYKPGHRVSVRAGGGNATFNVGPQGAATGQTHNLGPLWIHDNNINVNVNAIGGSGYGLTFDAVTLRDGQTAKIVANTTLGLASVAPSGSSTANHLTFKGTGTTTVTGAVSGVLKITKEEAGTLILQGVNTYNGDTVISAGTLTLADNAQLKFVIPATSPNGNKTITGAGTCNLNGDFYIDTALTDASVLTTGSWLIENVPSLSGAYGSTFQVVDSTSTPWTNAGAEKWTKLVGSKFYTFDETTGTLTLSPPPSPYGTWAATNAGGQTAELDHNNDGVQNGVAYFMNLIGFGTNPVLNPVTKKITWPNGGNISDTAYGTQFVVQTSTDLTNPLAWTDVLITDPNLINTATELSYTLTGTGPLFVRLKVNPL